MNKQTVLDQIETKWYPQGFNCTPFLLTECGNSGFDLSPALNDDFKHFIYEIKEGYGKMYYAADDLERLAEIVTEKIKDNEWLPKIRKESDEIYDKAIKKVKNVDSEKLSNEELINLILKALYALRTNGIYGHLIEPFSLTKDTEVKNRLAKYVKDEGKLNQHLSLLSTPTERSFLNEREEDLGEIKNISDENERKERIKQHLKKFHWARNTYAGKGKITEKDIEEELPSINFKPLNFKEIKNKKEELIEELGLDEELKMLLEASEFMTNWQDERKKDIFIAIDCAEHLLEELSRRLNIEVKFLRYLVRSDINMNLFTENDLKEKLEERRAGVVFYSTSEGMVMLTGDDYKEFHKEVGKKDKQEAIKEFNGMAASLGTAVGPVKICKSLSDIEKVKDGDILVSSMTRPEYLPAMKKAAAIVTDEGGITCHAAIVSRELRIPCVIGTKIATQVLKDGMSVEVKANHGLVLVLE